MARQLPKYAFITRRLLSRVSTDLRKAEQALIAANRGELAHELAEDWASIATACLAHDSAEAEIAEPYLQEMARLRAERDDLIDRLDAIRSILEEMPR